VVYELHPQREDERNCAPRPVVVIFGGGVEEPRIDYQKKTRNESVRGSTLVTAQNKT